MHSFGSVVSHPSSSPGLRLLRLVPLRPGTPPFPLSLFVQLPSSLSPLNIQLYSPLHLGKHHPFQHPPLPLCYCRRPLEHPTTTHHHIHHRHRHHSHALPPYILGRLTPNNATHIKQPPVTLTSSTSSFIGPPPFSFIHAPVHCLRHHGQAVEGRVRPARNGGHPRAAVSWRLWCWKT